VLLVAVPPYGAAAGVGAAVAVFLTGNTERNFHLDVVTDGVIEDGDCPGCGALHLADGARGFGNGAGCIIIHFKFVSSSVIFC